MRNTSHSSLNKIFIERWSPRAFTPDKIEHEDLMTIFEAARWSPSCFNEQPWRFVYATSDSDLARFQAVLADANKTWASSAPVLIMVFSKKHFNRNDKDNRWADFDTGAAWMALTLQANALGLHTHAMGGFDKDAAFEVASVDPDKYNALCVIALGKLADVSTLPEDLQAKETPSERNTLDDMISEGIMS